MCGNKLSFFASIGNSICKECDLHVKNEAAQKRVELEMELAKIMQQIIATKSIDEGQIETLIKQTKQELVILYDDILDDFESDGELDQNELECLQAVKSSLELSNEDVDFEKRVMPYHYVYMIKNENKLPNVQFSYVDNASPIILKKGEEVHFASPSILKEMKTTNLGYQGGSRGVSIRVMKGVNYRVGSHRGYVKKEEKLVETSSGYLLLTNKRIFLHPSQNCKPVSIPLNKILSYNCFENGVEIYKDGREKGYFFETKNEGAPEIIGMCLGFMFENN
jgi:hypothetical protein